MNNKNVLYVNSNGQFNALINKNHDHRVRQADRRQHWSCYPLVNQYSYSSCI